MRYFCFFLIAAALTSCAGRRSAAEGQPANINLAETRDEPASLPVKVNGLTVTQLSGDTADAFFSKAEILDVIGDTMILLESNPQVSRLLMFNVSDGSYLGQISHRGQGPGEYRMILGAFADGKTNTAIIPDFDSPRVNVYSLAGDTLVRTIERTSPPSMIEPIGSVETAINFAYPSPDGLNIYQYDADFNRIDSINVPGFIGGNFSTVWANAGKDGVMMIADTLYTLQPGKLQPVAILSRPGCSITPDDDNKIMEKIMNSGESEIEILRPYMLVRNVRIDGNKMLLTTMFDAAKTSDLYDLTTGQLISRSKYEDLSVPSCMTVKSDNDKTVTVERLFAKNGKWYGIVSEDNAPQTEEAPSDNTNYSIVSFSLQD